MQRRMKEGPKAPPTQLPYVPLHAAEFIKLSVCRAVKDPVLRDFPPLACRLNLTMSLNIVHCMAEGVFLITPQTLDPVFFPQQFLFLLSFFFFLFFLTSMLVKRYIQQLTDLFDGDEELIYGHTFIITHNSSLQALYPVEILVFFFSIWRGGG